MLDKWLSSYNNWGKLHTSLSCGSCCPRSRIRRAVKYSGRLSRQFRCVCTRRAAWHSAFPQAR